ncbi:unnamed protein product [Caenorhabditis nigoni]
MPFDICNNGVLTIWTLHIDVNLGALKLKWDFEQILFRITPDGIVELGQIRPEGGHSSPQEGPLRTIAGCVWRFC